MMINCKTACCIIPTCNIAIGIDFSYRTMITLTLKLLMFDNNSDVDVNFCKLYFKTLFHQIWSRYSAKRILSLNTFVVLPYLRLQGDSQVQSTGEVALRADRSMLANRKPIRFWTQNCIPVWGMISSKAFKIGLQTLPKRLAPTTILYRLVKQD